MELDTIRKQLDKLGQCLDYVMLLRMALVVLVGEEKEQQNIPVYQPGREQKIYESRRSFAQDTGLHAELLVSTYKNMIADAIRIEEDMERYRLKDSDRNAECMKGALDRSEEALCAFITAMDEVKTSLQENGIEGDAFFKAIAGYYDENL